MASTLNVDQSMFDNVSPIKDLNTSIKAHPVVSEADELDMEQGQDEQAQAAGDGQQNAQDPDKKTILFSNSDQFDATKELSSGVASPNQADNLQALAKPPGSRL